LSSVFGVRRGIRYNLVADCLPACPCPPGWRRNSSNLVARTRALSFTRLSELVEDEKFKSPDKRDTEDVVVIGSSAAGLYTAARVAHGGRGVSVLESKATPDPAPRTLIVTDYFKNQISAAARSSILNEIRRFELFTDGRSAQVTLKQPDLIIERSRLIRTADGCGFIHGASSFACCVAILPRHFSNGQSRFRVRPSCVHHLSKEIL